jgi:hypothetical protein
MYQKIAHKSIYIKMKMQRVVKGISVEIANNMDIMLKLAKH